MWTDLRQDIAVAVRMLFRTPAFSAVAILTLTLGIGATTAIFTLANWTLFRPVPGTTDPEDVRIVWTGQWTERGSFTPNRVSYPNYADIVPWLKTLAGIAGYQGGDVALATEREAFGVIDGQYVTVSYFSTLGVKARAGRLFTPDEDQPGSAAHVAVISDRLWAALFNRSDAVFQQLIRVNGVPFTIVGVTPRGFGGPDRGRPADIWLLGAVYPIVNHQSSRYEDREQGGFYEFVVRLAPGATWTEAEAELKSLAPWLAEQHPTENRRFQQAGFHLFGPIGERPGPAGGRQLRDLLGLMMAASALVLLIACANVASLLSIRGVARRNEVAIRRALGASRLRLVRQHMTEGTVLWLLGGVGGMLVVWALTRIVRAPQLIGMDVPPDAPPVDWRVITFTAGLSLAVGLVFSLLPAIRTARADPATTLRDTTQTAASRATLSAAFTVVQLAASVTLLVSALMLAASIRNLSKVPLGFDPAGLTTFRTDPMRLGYSEVAAMQYAREFQQRLAGIPGVRSVAFAQAAPLDARFYTRIRRRGASAEEVHRTLMNEIGSPGYFRTVGIELRRGRLFNEADLAQSGGPAQRVVILSENLARRVFGLVDAVGEMIEFPVRGREKQTYEVIGVVADSRLAPRLVGETEPVLYEPVAPDGAVPRVGLAFVVRTHDDFESAPEIRAIAKTLDPALPLGPIIPLSDMVERQLSEWKLLGWLTMVLTIIAAMLAAVGLYGVIGFAVAQRLREFGIRLALGAAPTEIARLVFRRAAAISLVGLACGFAGALASVRAIESRLVGVDKFEPTVWFAAALGLTVVVALASIIPARRAMRADVSQTLRSL
jgi:predicted permease